MLRKKNTLLFVLLIFFLFVNTSNSREKGQKFFYTANSFLNYEEIGTGRQTILFLHGFGESLTTWDDIIPFFSEKRYKLILLDLKGFGKSSKPKDGKYAPKDHVEIIVKFIEAKGLQNFTLVGHSYGGGIALLTQLHLQQMEKGHLIEKMVLIDCGAYKDEIPFFIKQLRTPLFNLISQSLTTPKFRAKYVLKQILYDKKKMTATLIDRYTESFKGSGKHYSFIQAAKKIIPHDYDELIKEYKSITIPVLILWGANDTILTLKIGIKLNKDLPNSKLKIIENCGHIPHIELPKETFQLMEEFFETTINPLIL
jgi:pimeloyl-ACP methyl ester carboxylesterase